MNRRLRIAGVVVQPILVWDDGAELTPGPQTDPATVPVSHLPALPAQWADQLAKLEAEAAGDALD